MIKVYRFDYSSYVRKVQIALEPMGADYRVVEAAAPRLPAGLSDSVLLRMRRVEQWQ